MSSFLIKLIKLYQKYGPEEMHQACVFTPTCSQYMILAVEKYGFIKGLAKGIWRILRCHQPNGGEDYP